MIVEAKGLDEAIRHLKEYKDQLVYYKMKRLIERLAEEGIQVASARFSNAQYAGHNDVECRIEWTADGCCIVASGASVLFIEFGSGTFFYEHPKGAELGFIRGTYGQGRGANPPWEYAGILGENVPLGTTYATNSKGIRQYSKDGEPLIKTMGNPPARAMYDAGKQLHEKVKEIAKEVFSHA